MSTTRHIVSLSLLLACSVGQPLVAAEEREADSVYSYGRWAVLSPAAGGIEPYIAALTPDALNNSRPDDPLPGADFDVLSGNGGTGIPPGIDDVNPDLPIITEPPNLPPLPPVTEIPPGIVDVDNSVPVVTAPPNLPALPPL